MASNVFSLGFFLKGVGGDQRNKNFPLDFFSLVFFLPRPSSHENSRQLGVWVCCAMHGEARCLSSIFPPGIASNKKKEENFHEKDFYECVRAWEISSFSSSYLSFSSFFFFTLHTPRLRNDVFRMFVDTLHNIVWRLSPSSWCERLFYRKMVNAMMTKAYIMRWREKIWLSFGNAVEFCFFLFFLFSRARNRWGEVAQYVID